ncbi:hypothetical protein [Nesterenkonia lutea]|uniref:DUF2550 domain-containing protein n=1 Tax=Nesterenkonia lutea TaxID=272919 RepID=A0ABR9JDR5_9MICC|nr:hypothetical protein [Nesterenkonia lutea]MBE1523918.1 hypothetical protein [Nesterenkonia lutea]
MDALTADTLAFWTIAGLAVAAVISAVIRGHLRAKNAITAEHQPERIILTAGGRIEVLDILNEGDSLEESLRRHPVDLPLVLAPDEPFTLAYLEFPDTPRPQKVVLRLKDDSIRHVDLPSL